MDRLPLCQEPTIRAYDVGYVIGRENLEQANPYQPGSLAADLYDRGHRTGVDHFAIFGPLRRELAMRGATAPPTAPPTAPGAARPVEERRIAS